MIKRFLLIVLLLFVINGDSAAKDAQVAAPTSQPAAAKVVNDAKAAAKVAPVEEPKDVKEATEKVKEAIAAAKSGQWWYFSGLVLLVLMYVLKLVKVLEKIGRWKYIILPILSIAAAILASWKGGVSIEQAVGVFTSSWAMASLEELWNHGILGKERGTQ